MSALDVAAIVLAGGTSTRFGSDKLAAELDGRPVLHHALDAVGSVADLIVIVLAPGATEPRLPPGLVDRVRVTHDRTAHAGPLAGLAAGLAAVRDEPPRIAVVVGGDMPSLVPGVLRRLADALAGAPSLAAMSLAASPAAPLPLAVRPAAVLEAADACLAEGRRSLRALLDAVPSAVLASEDWRALDPDAATLRDIDRPEDLGRR